MSKKLILSAVVIFLGVYVYNCLYSVPPVPVIEDVVWKRTKNPNDAAVTPFTIDVPQQVNAEGGGRLVMESFRNNIAP